MMKDILIHLFGSAPAALSPAFLIAQAIGPITTVISIASAQLKNVKGILLLELIANLLVAITYLLLGGDAGAYICLTACVQTTVSYLYSRKNVKCPNGITLLFLVVYIGITVIGYKIWMDILPGLCAVAFALAIVQTNAARYRLFMTANTLIWVVYDLLVGAYSTILTHGLLLISLLLAMVRLDLRKNGVREYRDH